MMDAAHSGYTEASMGVALSGLCQLSGWCQLQQLGVQRMQLPMVVAGVFMDAALIEAELVVPVSAVGRAMDAARSKFRGFSGRSSD